MLLLDSGYTGIKNKYVVRLSNYYIQYRQLRNNNIKETLLSKTQNVKKGQSKNEFIFIINEEDLFKGLLGDVLLFYLRSIQQGNDYRCIETNLDISPNWNIVTNYYEAFFDASLLLRLCYRGNIFINGEYKKDIEKIISIHLNEPVSLDSNLFYYIEKVDGDFVLRLTKSESNTHEVVWNKSREVLEEMMLLSNNKSDELTFLESCRQILVNYGNTFPSKLRNKVNYQPIYGLDAVDKKFYRIHSEFDWIKEILSFDSNKTRKDDNSIINLYAAYSNYIHVISRRLIQDYFEMSGRDDHVLASINKNRQHLIIEKEVGYSY